MKSAYPIRAAWATLSFDDLTGALHVPVEDWVEPGLGPSKGFSIVLSTGHSARIEWRELQPQYIEICLEYDHAFSEADLRATAEWLGVGLPTLHKEEGQIKWVE